MQRPLPFEARELHPGGANGNGIRARKLHAGGGVSMALLPDALAPALLRL